MIMFETSLSVDANYFASLYPTYDFEFLNKLFSVWSQPEGSTFGWDSMNGSTIQTNFHKKVFQEVNPNRILEVGTHKGSYSYFAKKELPKVQIHTFGIDSESKTCVDMINEHFNEEFITFIEGNSAETLTIFKTRMKFNLAWIDGGHTYEECLSDLKNCARLNITNILVDDNSMSTVSNAVSDFCKEFNYNIKEQSADERIIAWLVK